MSEPTNEFALPISIQLGRELEALTARYTVVSVGGDDIEALREGIRGLLRFNRATVRAIAMLETKQHGIAVPEDFGEL